MPESSESQTPAGSTTGNEKAMDASSLLHEAQLAQSRGDLRQALRLSEEVKHRFKGRLETNELKQADEMASSMRKEISKSEFGPLSMTFAFLFGLGIWIIIGFGIAAIFSQTVRIGWAEHWRFVPIGAGVLLLGLGLSRFYENKMAAQPEGLRRAMTVFTVVPLIAVAMLAVITLSATGMAFVLEIIFILLASLIPAAAYYLFLSARRPSILNEFIANLSRLGLLSPRPVRRVVPTGPGSIEVRHDYESPKERSARIEGYFQRFEAIYGTLRFSTSKDILTSRSNFVARLVEAIDTKEGELPSPEAAVHITDMFRPNLIIPIGMVTILTTLGWLLVMQPDFSAFKSDFRKDTVHEQSERRSSNPGGPEAANESTTASGTNSGSEDAKPGHVIAELTPVWTPVGLAFLGAYFFGIQMIFRRFVRRDLGPAAYLALTNRIILAVISVWVVLAGYAALENDAGYWNTLMGFTGQEINWPPVVMVAAFVVGVFPRVLWQFISAAVTKIPLVKLVIPAVESKQPLSELDGLTIWHESRLEEEDVENVPNMATIDMVDIMLHTQIPAERLVSWVDQAILLVALGTRDAENEENRFRQKIFALGLRSASQVIGVYSGDTLARQALADAMGESAMRAFVQALQFQSNFDAVCSWRCVTLERELLLLHPEKSIAETNAHGHPIVTEVLKAKEKPLQPAE